MLPSFIILGTQKSASTFVQNCLSEHPEIYMPSDEIPFFESPDYENSTISDLENLFNGCENKLLGIKRPSYLAKPEVPTRIKKHIPNAKLIVILRNPIERAVSAYYHNMNYSFIPVEDIEKGMEELLNGHYENSFKRAKEIIDFGFYYQQLTRYLKYFDRKQLMICFHEDIVENKVGQIQKIYDFLAVESSYLPKAIDSKPQAVIYNKPRLRLLSMRNRFVYEYNRDRTRLFVKDKNALGKIVARFITVSDKLFLSKMFISRKPKLSDRISTRLYSVYREDIQMLERLLGRNLNHWKPIKHDPSI